MRVGLVFDARTKIMIGAAFVYLLTVMPLQAALEDPTRPPTATATIFASSKKQSRPRWVLSSTLVSAQRRTAVVNDKVVARGDRINGARVISIEPSSVRLRAGGRDITLVMLGKDIKSSSQVTSSGHQQ
jgi:MSHA biogenesis protein MshK